MRTLDVLSRCPLGNEGLIPSDAQSTVSSFPRKGLSLKKAALPKVIPLPGATDQNIWSTQRYLKLLGPTWDSSKTEPSLELHHNSAQLPPLLSSARFPSCPQALVPRTLHNKPPTHNSESASWRTWRETLLPHTLRNKPSNSVA